MSTLKHILLICICISGYNISFITSDGSWFANPVFDTAIGRASAIKVGSFYYMALSTTGREIEVLKSPFLTDFRNAERQTIYAAPSGYTSVYPSSFLKHENQVYLYFGAISPSGLQQMFVIKSKDATNLFDQWSAPTRLLENVWNEDSRNAAAFQTGNQLYFVLSSSKNSTISLYIAKMASPTEVLNPICLLRQPTEDWECCTNQAPAFIYNRNTVYMVFSVLSSDNPNSALSYMSIDTDLDPMLNSNWVSAPGPVFTGNPEESIYGTRFPSFITSPDETETWLLYTSFSNVSNVSESSRLRIDKVEWNKVNGSPEFPLMRGNGVQQQLPSGEPSKFTNPIIDDQSRNPNVYFLDNMYYLVLPNVESTELVMLKSDKLYNFRDAEKTVIYRVPEGFQGVSTGQIVKSGEEFYMYFQMGKVNEYTQIYVSKAENSTNLMQGWGTPETLLNGLFEDLAYHGVVINHDNKLYLVWASANAAGSKIMYIAPMSSPTQVIEPVVLLKEPRQPWECNEVYCLNDFPSPLYGPEATFLVYTGNAVFNTNCALSYMSIGTGRDPLDVINWYTNPEPVFHRNDVENVYAPCHASFTTSPDSSEDWMLYQASNITEDLMKNSVVRVDRVTWDPKTGTPVFPKPHGFSHPQPIPSSFQYFTNPVIDESLLSPDITRIENFYYLLHSNEAKSEIIMLKSAKLTDFRNSERKVLFSAPEGFSNIGIARMHIVIGKLCIYFSMEELEYFQRIFVVCAEDPTNPMGKWDTLSSLVAPSLNYSAYHGTILEHGGNTYLTWVTPHPATGFNSISIAKLENATAIVEPIALIRHPFELWECDGGCSNEAPFFIYNGGTAYMVHSVGMACKVGNALTYMSIASDKDPLNAADWFKAPGKTFEESEEESVFCPSHATFTSSPDGLELWMMYHATDSPHPDAIKTARIEKITWQENGEVVFPIPHGHNRQQLVPGQKKYF